VLLKFLCHFFELTLKVSGSLHVTSNVIFTEVSLVLMTLNEWYEQKEDQELQAMATRMKEKFDKYWGSVKKMNKILFYAVILDPRRKMEFVNYTFDQIYDDELVRDELKDEF